MHIDKNTISLTKSSKIGKPKLIFPVSVVNSPLPLLGDVGLTPRLGRSPGDGNSKPLQYFCLGNPMDRGAWPATVFQWSHTGVSHNLVTKPTARL